MPLVRSELRLKVGVPKRLTFLLVLPSISCHQFSAGQVLDVVVVSDELLLSAQKVVFSCKTFLTSPLINFRQNDDSSIFAQEMTVILKRNTEKILSIYLTWFPFCGCRRTQYIPEYGGFYKNWVVCGGVSKCEELVGAFDGASWQKCD